MLDPRQVRALAEELSGYAALPPYEAALPFYECILEVRMMVRHPLTPLEMVVLSVVATGVDEVDSMVLVLGLEQGMVTDTLADLHNGEFIQPRSAAESHRFSLTEKGREGHDRASVLRPESLRVRALFDALTGDWVPPSRLDYLNPGDAARRGLHLVPAKLSPPAVADVDRGALGEALKESRKHNAKAVPDADLHDVVEVLQTFRAYLPCDVVAFDSADASHVIFRVLQSGRRMTEHEDVLNALFPRMPEILPFADAPAPAPPEAEASRAFAESVLTEVDGLHDSAAEIQGRIAQTAGIIAEASVDGGEIMPATTRMQLDAVRAELAELRRQFEEVSARLASVRRIEVHEHRPLLIKAIEKSRSRLIVIAPWLRDVAMSDLLNPIRKALDERPVQIYIGWGYPDDARNPVKAELNESMRRELERMAKQPHRGKLHVTMLGDTHEKVLLSDRKFMVITSFNWLSFRGDPKRPLRQETGLYLEIPEKIDEAASVFLQRLGIPPEKQPHVPEASSSARPALEDDATRLARAGFSVKPSRRSR
jgi:hypothetical protein